VTATEFTYLALGALAVVVAVGVLLFVGARRAPKQLPGSAATPTVGGAGGAHHRDDDADLHRTGVLPPASGADEVLPDAGAGVERTGRDTPEAVAGRMVRLRSRLAGSRNRLGQSLLGLLSRETVDAATWQEVEDTLLLADLGPGPAETIVESLRTQVAVLGTRDVEQVRALLRAELLRAVDPGLDRSLAVERHEGEDGGRPAVVLVVGVNGTGKTTTVGKLARVLVAQDKDVVLGAADTFRAAAADQLTTWGERVGVPTIRSDREGGDPAAVAYDAVAAGIAAEADVVLIDTAGRLQNKVGLMDELGKVKRVLEKHGPVDEVLLVIDATTGQNGMEQARVFGSVVQVTGIVLTKLDGTAKGGIVVAVQQALGVPVKLVGLGEGPDDLAPFDPEAFVDALISLD
jgi:fused signal recognition particle receptor